MNPLGPVGVFDAGLGAYGVVARIRQLEPSADVVYLADRASFPYGRKGPDELVRVVVAAAAELERRGCTQVVVASNAPSVMVLPQVAASVGVPVHGVFPPVREAVRSVTGEVVVAGAASMVASPQLAAYVEREAGQAAGRVHVRAAGELIALVESAAFLEDANRTQAVVDAFVAGVRRQWPRVEALTLSSTHLPWLRPFVERAAPGVLLLDPAEDVAREVLAGVSTDGAFTCLVTERPGLSAVDFSAALRRLTDAAGERPLVPQVLAPLT